MAGFKKIFSFVLRFVITAGILIYIFSQAITFDDYIVLKNDTVVRGDINDYTSEGVCIITSEGKEWYSTSEISNQKNIARKAVHFGFFKIWKKLNLSLFFPFASLFIADLLLCSLRFQWLLGSQGISVSFGKLVRINLIGIFFNNFLLGFTGGDVVRAYYVAKNSRQKTSAVVAVAMDRIIGLSALVILASCVLLFHLRKEEFFIPCLVIFGSFLGIVAGTISIFYVPEKLYAVREGMFFKVIGAFCHYRQCPRLLIYSVGISIIVQVFCNLAMLGFAKALRIELPFYVFFIYVPVALIFMALPISITGWGVGEASFGLLFSQVGVLFEEGVVLSLLFRLAHILLGIAGGFLLILGEKPPSWEEKLKDA